jgi:hypothetical protein
LQYQNVAAKTVRSSLKEPLKTQAKSRDVVHFRVRNYEGGKRPNLGTTVKDVA